MSWAGCHLRWSRPPPYILATGGTLAGYLGLFRARRADMLSRGEPAGYRGTVATTWALAFSRLEHSAPVAAGLLRLLACCAPEAIPLRLLLKTRRDRTDRPGGLTSPPEGLYGQVAAVLTTLLEDSLAVQDAIAALRRYSLVAPAAEGSVSVHRLVQAVTIDQMPEKVAWIWRRVTAVLIEAAMPDDPQELETWADWAALLPHAQVALTADSFGMGPGEVGRSVEVGLILWVRGLPWHGRGRSPVWPSPQQAR
jgi:hypothetical protein